MGGRKIDERTFDFALLVVDAYRFLLRKKEFVLSKQFLRAGTSIGANVTESQAAQSRKDFVSKMSIASKEARETSYWIRLLKKARYFEGYEKLTLLEKEITSITKILTSIVKTAKENNSKPKTHNPKP
ncbi:MAG: four helix bundle protein [Deltaproteobacteria bacterium]|nr:four helix bundle protein [Deltaproteobacteria bacterium]